MKILCHNPKGGGRLHPPPRVHSRALVIYSWRHSSDTPQRDPQTALNVFPPSLCDFPLEHSGFFQNRIAASLSGLQLGIDDVWTPCKVEIPEFSGSWPLWDPNQKRRSYLCRKMYVYRGVNVIWDGGFMISWSPRVIEMALRWVMASLWRWNRLLGVGPVTLLH